MKDSGLAWFWVAVFGIAGIALGAKRVHDSGIPWWLIVTAGVAILALSVWVGILIWRLYRGNRVKRFFGTSGRFPT